MQMCKPSLSPRLCTSPQSYRPTYIKGTELYAFATLALAGDTWRSQCSDQCSTADGVFFSGTGVVWRYCVALCLNSPCDKILPYPILYKNLQTYELVGHTVRTTPNMGNTEWKKRFICTTNDSRKTNRVMPRYLIIFIYVVLGQP
jgi:hypothetical protein